MKHAEFKKWHGVLLLIIIVFAVGYKIYNIFWHKTVAVINGAEIKALVAGDSAKRFKGLSGRENLGEYGGMLFVFPNEDRHTMVMRDMLFPLDIVWINGGRILDIAPNVQLEPGKKENELVWYIPRAPANMVLEMPAGSMRKYGLKIGDRVKINF